MATADGHQTGKIRRRPGPLVLWPVVHPCLPIPDGSPTIRANHCADHFPGGLMSIFRISKFGYGLMLTTAFAVSMWPAVSRAYTPEQEQACTSDAFRLCSSEIPDVDRVTACMVARKSELSPPCRAQFR